MMSVGVFSRMLLLAAALLASTSLAQGANNYAHASQSGIGNAATITQGPGSENEIGSAVLAARQNGNENVLTLTQSGDDNDIGTSGSGLEQISYRNTASILQSSNGNGVRQLTQTGNGAGFGPATFRRNVLAIEQKDGDANVVSAVAQTHNHHAFGAANTATLIQSGTGNVIGTASGTAPGLIQSGDGQSAVVTQTGTSNRIALVRQSGARNTMTVSLNGDGNGTSGFAATGDISGAWGGLAQGTIVQDNDHFGAYLFDGNTLSLDISGTDNSYAIAQFGSANTVLAGVTGSANQIGILQGGGGNDANLTLTGARNLVFLEQGAFGLGLGNLVNVLASGDDNHVGIRQIGVGNALELSITSGNGNTVNTRQSGPFGLNSAGIAISGDDNRLTLDQSGGNTLNVDIFGDDNNGAGAGSFDGAALTAASALTPGTAIQSGWGNDIALSVGATGAPANGNLFAFSQSGNGNSIDGMILGSANQVAIVQAGNNNHASFTQNGTGNSIGVNQ